MMQYRSESKLWPSIKNTAALYTSINKQYVISDLKHCHVKMGFGSSACLPIRSKSVECVATIGLDSGGFVL